MNLIIINSFFKNNLTLIVYLRSLFSLNNLSSTFFMLFLLTDDEALKFLLLITTKQVIQDFMILKLKGIKNLSH